MNSIFKRVLAMGLAALMTFSVASQSTYAENPKNNITITPDNAQKQYTISIENISEEVTSVFMPVWSEKDGQDDICWYTATEISEGKWQCAVDVTNHKSNSGKYQVHVYGALADGTNKLLKGSSFEVDPITEGTISAIALEKSKGLYRLELSGINSPAGISRVTVAVWSSKMGQDDLIWYEATSINGKWYVDLDVRNHGYETGNYYAHCYAYDYRGMDCFAANTIFKVTAVKRNIFNTQINADHTQVTLTLSNANLPEGMTAISFPVWGEANGQNDIRWYDATRVDATTYQAIIPISNHMEIGTYSAHVYATGTGVEFLTHGKFEIDGISADVNIINVDNENGYFTVEVSNVVAPSGVASVQIPVWTTKNSQDDIHWYTPEKVGDKWVLTVDIGDHLLETGIYNAHVYIKDNRGFQNMVAAESVKISALKLRPTITAQVDLDAATAELKISNIGEAQAITVPVWGEVNGQNDIYWYSAERVNTRTWIVTVPLASHNEIGRYQAHVYKITGPEMALATHTNFNVEEIRVNAISSVNHDDVTGEFTVNIVNPQGISNINSVRIAVWSAEDGQDDLTWYNTTLKGNTWSVRVNPVEHYFDKGHYYVHVYAYNATGESVFIGGIIPVIDFNGKLGFVEEGKVVYYYTSLNEKAYGFERIRGERYFFDRSTGEMATGWKYIDGYKYYFDEDGKMLQDVDSLIGLQSSYYLKINVAQNIATMYAYDPATGTYCIPVKAMTVSTGDATPMGTYRLGQTFRWLLMFNGTYCQYLSLITDDFLLHSITYETTDIYTLQTVGYNRIGSNKSAGCVRFRCGEAYWIYTLVNSGHLRQVTLYRDSTEVTPFERPYYAPIPENQTWDPTDPAITGKWDLY